MAPVLISAAIEIAASPDVVRAKFLDFSTIHLYHHPPGLMKSLTPLDGAQGKTGMELQEGDWVKIVTGNNVVTPMILANDEKKFVWRNSLPFARFSLIDGTHTFHFTPAASSTPKSPRTYFVQEETVVGLFAWVCRFASVQNMMRKEFEVLNTNLKLWVESRTTGST